MLIRRIFSAVLLTALLAGVTLPIGAANTNERVVQVAVCPHTPPFQFLDSNGQPAGIHIDIIEHIAKQNNLSVSYTIYDTKSECISALNRGEADVVLGYQMQEYDSTDHLVTSELSSGSISIVASKGMADYLETAGRPSSFAIAFEYGAVNYSLLHSLGFLRLLSVGNQEQAVQALLSGQVDTTVGIAESIEYILLEQGADKDFKTLHNRVGTIQYAILVDKSLPSLYRLLDKALIEMHISGVYEEISDSWVPNRTQQLQTLIKALLVLAFFTLLAAAVILWFNHLLRQKVAVKTNMLYEANQSLEKTVIKLQNEAVFRNRMIDSLPVAAILFNPDFSVTLMNPQAKKLFGPQHTGDEIPNAKQLPIFGQILQQMDDNILSGDTQLQPKHFFNLGDPALPQKYNCWIHRLAEEDHISSTLMMVENVTQEVRRRNERFAIEKARSLNQVVAGIAHEIKNPLMTIKTAVSLMATQWENPNVKDAFVQFIPDEVDRMNTLVESLLSYAKPPTEQFSVFRLSELVLRSFHLAKISDNKSKIHFSIVTDNSLNIRGQWDLLRQALTNLLINSMWAVNQRLDEDPPEGWTGSIRGKVYPEADWVCLSVYDNGMGMSADVIARCTEPFFTTKLAGTGLGLPLVKQYVENSGGQLSIASQEHQYTEILIRLPRHNPESQ